jgi:epsilon-lactone hydrolase
VSVIPIDDDDIPAGRALRAEFSRFWSTARGQPRAVYDRFIAATPIAADITAEQVTDGPGPGIWVRPAGAAPDRAVLFVHGGGYGLGSVPAYIGLVSQIAARAGISFFALDYPLAPEAQVPEALDLAVETLRGLCSTHAAVAIAGESAGGGLSLATAARAVQERLDVAAVSVFSPWTDLSLSGTSVREQAVGDPLLDPAYLRASAAAYLGSAAPDDPRASPLFGVTEGLPPLLIQVGTDEILLDDSRRFADAVASNGGTVRLEVWQGMHHVFQLNVEQLVSARRALDNAAEFLAEHLTR